MRKIIPILITLLILNYNVFPWSSPNPNPNSCLNCTNTRIILKINKVNYYSNWGLYRSDTPLPICTNSIGMSGFDFDLKTDKGSAAWWRNSNYYNIPGEITLNTCNFIYGGTLTVAPLNCNLIDKDGTYTYYTCKINVSVPKVACNKSRVVQATLICSH